MELSAPDVVRVALLILLVVLLVCAYFAGYFVGRRVGFRDGHRSGRGAGYHQGRHEGYTGAKYAAQLAAGDRTAIAQTRPPFTPSPQRSTDDPKDTIPIGGTLVLEPLITSRVAPSASGASPGWTPPQPPEHIQLAQSFNENAERFRDAYKPSRFGVLNAGELARNPSASPVFGRTEGGSYWLVPSSESDTAWAVPRAGLVVSTAEFEVGGMSAIFDTSPAFRLGSRYREVRVERPARLRPRGESWDVIDRGALTLGGEESEA